jgi:transposase
MWKPEHHVAADRSLRYPSDLTDGEWAIVEPMIPPARHGGALGECARGSERNFRHPVDRLPMAGPGKGPATEEHGADYLELWNWDGTLERIHHALYVAVREQEGREASPSVAIIDSQTAKGAQKGGLGSILQATTRARRSRVASGTSWSTRWVSC